MSASYAQTPPCRVAMRSEIEKGSHYLVDEESLIHSSTSIPGVLTFEKFSRELMSSVPSWLAETVTTRSGYKIYWR